MPNQEELERLKETCSSLSHENLRYVLAAAEALKYAEDVSKRNPCPAQKREENGNT